MNCPNCGRTLDPDKPATVRAPDYMHSHPNPGHSEGCILVALLGTLQDRGHNLAGADIEKIDADMIWDQFGGPATDAIALDLGLETYP